MCLVDCQKRWDMSAEDRRMCQRKKRFKMPQLTSFLVVKEALGRLEGGLDAEHTCTVAYDIWYSGHRVLYTTSSYRSFRRSKPGKRVEFVILR